jgi:UPF0716 protein FxsA
MGLLIVCLFLILPFLELWVIIESATVIGVGWTFALLVGMSVLGGFLVKREGTALWRQTSEALAEGRMPTREVGDGALVLFGAALMLTPGFITDIVGLVLVFPFTRAVLRPLVVGALAKRAQSTFTFRTVGFGTPTQPHSRPDASFNGEVIDGEVVDEWIYGVDGQTRLDP